MPAALRLLSLTVVTQPAVYHTCIVLSSWLQMQWTNVCEMQAEAAAAEQEEAIAKVLRNEVDDWEDLCGVLRGRSMLTIISESVQAALAASSNLTAPQVCCCSTHT